jgi:hypothetical protein
VWNHGLLCCLAYTLALSCTGVFVKLLGHRLPVVQVAAVRSAVAWLTSAAIAYKQVGTNTRLRGCCSAGDCAVQAVQADDTIASAIPMVIKPAACAVHQAVTSPTSLGPRCYAWCQVACAHVAGCTGCTGCVLKLLHASGMVARWRQATIADTLPHIP